MPLLRPFVPTLSVSPTGLADNQSQRSQYTTIIEQYLNGVSGNFSWFPWEGVDLLFGKRYLDLC